MGDTRNRAGSDRDPVGPSALPALPALSVPAGLFVEEHVGATDNAIGAADPGSRPAVILVHGSLDRAASFSRLTRRLADLDVVTYDRRGYQRSREAAVSDDLSVHVEDLVQIARACTERRRTDAGVVAVGHSVGATIVVGAAVWTPELFRAVGAYEPSMPWLGFHRERAAPQVLRDPVANPAAEVERFFRRMVGDGAWERLPDERREELRRDGPALLADLRAIRRAVPFDVTTLRVPAIVASGGPSSFAHHLDTASWLVANVGPVRRWTIADAGHGAHLSHPDAFAEFVRAVITLGTHGGAE